MFKALLSFCIIIVTSISCQQPVSTEKQLDILFDSIFKKDEPGGAVLIATDNKIIFLKSGSPDVCVSK